MYFEQRRVWSLWLTVVTIAVVAAIGGMTRMVWASRLSIVSWLVVMAGLAIVGLALSAIRLVAEIDGDDVVVRVLGLRLLNVQLEDVSSIIAVPWREPPALARWVLDDVMPPGGVQISTTGGKQHFIASAEPDRLATLIGSHL